MSATLETDQLLADCGLKKTTFRRELLATLQTAKAPQSAAQIFALLLKNKKLKNAKFDRATLFRNLKILVQKNALNATEFGTGAAFYCLNHERNHHHHIFCIQCETTKPLAVCAVAPMIDQAQRLGFKVLNHRLELLGLCPDCR